MTDNPCPYCGAAAGDPCMIVTPHADWSWTGRQYRMRYVHKARREAAP